MADTQGSRVGVRRSGSSTRSKPVGAGSSMGRAPAIRRRRHLPSGESARIVAPRLIAMLRELADEAELVADRELATRLASVCHGHTTLPVFPESARELDRLLRASRPSMRDVLRVVRTDPELSRRVIEIASSAAFTDSTSDLDAAVVRIGLDRLWRLAMQSLVGSTMFRAGPHQLWADEVRENGVRVAELASRLASDDQRGNAYLVGLLHEVGTLCILRFAAGSSRAMGAASASFADEVRVRCQSAIGVIVSEHWKLSPDVVRAIASHAQSEPTDPLGRLVQAARLALEAVADDLDVERRLTVLGVDAALALSIARELARAPTRA